MTNKRKNTLLFGSIVSFFIVAIPYLLYFHKLFAEHVKEYNFGFIHIVSGYYPDVQIFLYFLLSKLVPLLLFIIWFLTTKQWWAFAISIPIVVYITQLIGVINDSVQYVDEVSFIYSVPIAIGVVMALYIFRRNLAVYVNAMDLKEEMDKKIDARMEKNKKFTDTPDF